MKVIARDGPTSIGLMSVQRCIRNLEENYASLDVRLDGMIKEQDARSQETTILDIRSLGCMGISNLKLSEEGVI